MAMTAFEVPGLPDKAKAHFQRLALEPATVTTDLEARVRAYLDELRSVAATTEFVDLELAHSLTEACLRLLERFEELAPERRAMAQAAVQYFVLQDDAEDDLSVIGLDDDVAVFNAVARHLGFSDLAVEVP